MSEQNRAELPSDETETAPVEATSEPESDARVEQEMRRISRRSFLWGGVALGVGYTSWRWLISRGSNDGIPWPFRRALEIDERVARDLFQPYRLAPTFARAQADEPRANGDEGLSDDLDPDSWRLKVEGVYQATTPMTLTLADIKKLPRHEMTTQLKCIEGWSVIVNWVGARFSDFAAAYPPPTRNSSHPDVSNRPQDLVQYVGMETPDGGYYIGLDMESALHPQTLLCYEMNGAPLTSDHGAPLRLVIPVKYGIKHIKRIGVIRYTDRRPADYWAERGYDWYAGH